MNKETDPDPENFSRNSSRIENKKYDLTLLFFEYTVQLQQNIL